MEPGSRILFDYFYQRRDITRGQPFFDNLERIAKQRRQAEAARLAITDAVASCRTGLTQRACKVLRRLAPASPA